MGAILASVAAGMPGTAVASPHAAPLRELPMALSAADMNAGLVMDKVEKMPTYAGLRVAPDGSTIEVFATRAEASLHAAAVSAAGGAPVKLTTVRHSYAALEAMTQRVLRDWDAIEATGIDIVSLGVKHGRNLVEVGISGYTSEKAARILERYASPMVDVVERKAAKPWVSRAFDVSPWNGGTFIYTSSGDTCTSGPAVKNSSGQEFILTAGHCYVSPGTTVSTYTRSTWQKSPLYASGPFFGNAKAQLPANGAVGYDLAVINVNNDGGALGYNFQTDLPEQSGTYGAPQKRTIRMAENVRGCMSGAYSGERCAATVVEFNQYFQIGNGPKIHHANMFRRDNTEALGGPGDSGGPVYQVQSDGLAIGGYILGGPAQTTCWNNDYVDRGASCGYEGWFAGIGSILSYTGMSLLTA